jgi:hypothetical protein
MRAWILAVALVAGGCAGNTLANNGTSEGGGNGNGGTGGGNTHGRDMALQPLDLNLQQSVDDMAAGETCGDIVTCGISCLAGAAGGGGDMSGGLGGGLGGLGGLAGCTSCLQGAPPEATMEATAIITCAAQNCLSDITGGGGTAGIFECLASSCGMQLAGCSGLGLGI